MQPAAREVLTALALAGRAKDIEDVRNLWALHHATADRGRITQVLAMLEEALSQSDLVPAFEAIAGRPAP